MVDVKEHGRRVALSGVEHRLESPVLRQLTWSARLESDFDFIWNLEQVVHVFGVISPKPATPGIQSSSAEQFHLVRFRHGSLGNCAAHLFEQNPKLVLALPAASQPKEVSEVFTLRSQNGVRLSAYVCLRKNNWFREMAAEQGLHVRHLDCFLPTLKDKRHCDGNRLGATAGAWLNPGAKNGCGAYYVFAFLFIYVRSGGGEIAAQESVPTWLRIFSCILGVLLQSNARAAGPPICAAQCLFRENLDGQLRRRSHCSNLALEQREHFQFKCGGARTGVG